MSTISPARIAKALAAAVAAAQIALGTSQAGGGGQAVLDWTTYQWVWFSVSVIGAFIGVYAIPNTTSKTTPPVVEPTSTVTVHVTDPGVTV